MGLRHIRQDAMKGAVREARARVLYLVAPSWKPDAAAPNRRRRRCLKSGRIGMRSHGVAPVCYEPSLPLTARQQGLVDVVPPLAAALCSERGFTASPTPRQPRVHDTQPRLPNERMLTVRAPKEPKRYNRLVQLYRDRAPRPVTPPRPRAHLRPAQLAHETSRDARTLGHCASLTSLSWPAWWPVSRCRSVAGFEVSTEPIREAVHHGQPVAGRSPTPPYAAAPPTRWRTGA